MKIRVAIIRGGSVPEYHMLMKMGSFILQNIDRDLFEPIDIVVDKKNNWFENGLPVLPSDALSRVDVAFIVADSYRDFAPIEHILELHNIPYVGSRPFEKNIARHKENTKNFIKKLLDKLNFFTPKHKRINPEDVTDTKEVAREVHRQYAPPYIVKPISDEVSLGIKIAKTPKELEEVLEKLLPFGPVLVEEYILGDDISVCVLDDVRGEQYYSLPPMLFKHNFDLLSYEHKHGGKKGLVKMICPAPIDDKIKDKVQEIAIEIHKTIGLKDFSKIDFRIKKDKIFFLEANAIPKFYKDSPIVVSMQEVGIDPEEFIKHLIYKNLDIDHKF